MASLEQILINISDSIPTFTTIPEVIKESKHWWTNLEYPAIVSIVIFILGFFISDWINKNKKRKELELYKLLVVDWVKNSKKSIDGYIEILGTFAKEVKTSDSLNSVSFQYNPLYLNKLNTLPIEKLADALFVNLQTRQEDQLHSSKFFNLIIQLNFLDNNINLVVVHYEKYLKENELLLNEWNTHFVDLTRNIVRNFNDISKTEKEDEFYEYSITLQMDFINMQKQNEKDANNHEVARSICMNKYINPIYEYGSNNLQFANSQRFQTTMNLLHEVRMVNRKYNNLARYGAVFEEMNGENIKAQEVLFKSIEYYQAHKIKSAWKIK